MNVRHLFFFFFLLLFRLQVLSRLLVSYSVSLRMGFDTVADAPGKGGLAC